MGWVVRAPADCCCHNRPIPLDIGSGSVWQCDHCGKYWMWKENKFGWKEAFMHEDGVIRPYVEIRIEKV